MSTNSYRILFIALFAIVNSVIPISQSNAIGSGACTSTVGSDSGVVAANSGGFCYVAFTSTGSNSWTAPSGVTSVDLLIIAGPWGNVTSSPLSIRVTNRTGTRA
jgi:hypothetical protein